MMDEGDGTEIGRGKWISHDCVGAVREDPGVANIDTTLLTELGSEGNSVKNSAGRGLVDEIRLIEDVVAIGRVVIGGAVEGGFGDIDCTREWAIAGIDVLIEFLVVGDDRAVPHRQPVTEIMIDDGHAG